MIKPHAAGASYRLRVAAASDIGRVRKNNEDAHVVSYLGEAAAAPLDPGSELSFYPTERPVLLAVSDGMGGAAAGEVASALVVEVLRRSLPRDSPDWDTTLGQAVQDANREVWTAGQVPSRHGMGATLTAVCIHGHEAHLAEVGDSRAYLLRDGVLRLLTHDQSYVQMLLDSGAISPEEAERSPMKNVLLSAMGQTAEVRVDLGRLRLNARDRLLVCCDGLSNEVSAASIRDLLDDALTPSGACAQLIEAANDHGGRDNITVVVAFVEAPGVLEPAPAGTRIG